MTFRWFVNKALWFVMPIVDKAAAWIQDRQNAAYCCLREKGFIMKVDHFSIHHLLPDSIAFAVGCFAIVRCDICGKRKLFYAPPRALKNENAQMPGWTEFQEFHSLSKEKIRDSPISV